VAGVLLEMRLRGLGVIRDALLELGPGLTVITGETGAGKTMVVTGLGLLLGGRADAGAVRTGESSASVEARVVLAPGGPVATRAEDAGAELDDGNVLIVARSVSSEGRSRAFLGGRSVPVGLLGELAADLVTVHGQSDQNRLRSQVRQREALDRFAGDAVTVPLASYAAAWQRLRQVEARIDEITRRARERAQEAELLRLGLAEVERVAPVPGEDVALRAESVRLAHAEDLRTAASLAHAALAGGDSAGAGDTEADAGALVAAAHRALDGAGAHDEALAALADRVREIGYLLADVAADCASYVAAVESDPLRLAAVEERRAVLGGLTRAYGENVDAVLSWAHAASLRLLELDGDDDRVSDLRAERHELRTELGALAAQVSEARQGAADRLGALVTAELQGLSMPNARLEVAVSQREDPTGLSVGQRSLAAGPSGVDEVEMLLSPHAGAPPRALGRGASGGELSRVMLGLEVVLGGVDPVPTFVFDEVDAGVGGSAALGIGRRLARLARTSQVLVVTHLPQVAAFADRHLVVVKSADGEVTESGVRSLQDGDRVRELARMLGGLADSGSAQAHAEELITTAAAERTSYATSSGTQRPRRQREEPVARSKR
jgi:DNA repair protein RecN (Recombination protein N)